MHTTGPSLVHANSSPYNNYDVEIVSRGCHDTYDGALRLTSAIIGGEGEAFAWSHGQEETFRLPKLGLLLLLLWTSREAQTTTIT
jgi:hypothetical protein